MLAVYGKAFYSPLEGTSVHARLGVATVKTGTRVKHEFIGDMSSETDESLAYGVGAEVSLTDTLCLRFDLTQFNNEGDTANAVSLSLVNHF